jgi:starch-binding outer membrane protein, SusD/RagB family
MKKKYNIITFVVLIAALILSGGCSKKLDELPENRKFTAGTDYTKTSDMIKPLYGSYSDLNKAGWPCFPLISVRGDDVNAGGLGDQIPFASTDAFQYDKNYWMYQSLWEEYYGDILDANSSLEQIALFKQNASGGAPLADQYSAEVKVMRAWWLFHLSRVWGPIFIPTSSDPNALLTMNLSTKDEVMQHISAQMDEAIPLLPAVRPNERTDIRGGVTKFTALAMKALANLELKNYQAVADATGEIIKSGKFSLESDYYNLFKIKGKLNNENILEYNYTDFGQPSGDNFAYLYDFFAPQGWTPKVSGAADGWGFWEPSLKYIKFMLGRGEKTRLETTVLFTPRGIAELKKTTTIPAWITNVTPSGDILNDFAREMFVSGKHYLPSDQLTPGRTTPGTNNGFHLIRYSEILLMYAEALTQGASGTAGTADDAVNAVRLRAGLNTLTSVTNADVMDEKFAELACEWGERFYDNIRLGKTDELNYDGRTFTSDKTFLPYPQAEVDALPGLKSK